MGRAKAELPFGPETMLARVVRLVAEAVDRMVVVAAAGQKLPALPNAVEVVRDERPERGPLEGLAAGLGALGGSSELIYATSCDVPLLQPAFVRRMFELCGDFEAVVPRAGDHVHPLAAVYRPSVLDGIERMLAADRLRLVDLMAEIKTRYVTADEFAAADSQGHSLLNVNRPEDYTVALELAGFSARE